MPNLTPLTAAVYIQLLLVLIVAVIGLSLYLRRLKRQLRSAVEAPSSGEETAQTSTAHYFTTEIKLTQGRLETLYPDGTPLEPELTEADILTLREHYLGLEAELLQDTAREDVFWKRLADGVRHLLTDCHLVKRVPVTETEVDEDEEVAEISALMKQQQGEIDEFLSSFDGEDNALGPEELKERLRALANSHRELSHCIFSLEDENRFLREQIASLLKSA